MQIAIALHPSLTATSLERSLMEAALSEGAPAG